MEKKATRLAMLKERHQHLDDIIDEMKEQRYLTPHEREKLSTLKVQRLRLKDALRTLSSESGGFSMLPPKFELK